MAIESQDWVGLEIADGRYRIVSEIDRGGMGIVYKAFDKNLEDEVVIKVPLRSMLEDPEFSKRFEHEIRSLVKLRHPHIVRILDVAQHQGIPMAVMQYLPGGDVRARQKKDDQGKRLPVPAEDIAAWLPGIAEALDFIHQKNYIHRDVKPGNILFDEHGHAFLSDFGVAKVTADKTGGTEKMTGTGMVLGTPEYMSPELIMGEHCDGRVDQYALAVMAYELLCGQVPFQGATPAAILVNQTTKQAVPLHELCPTIPRNVSDVVMKGFAKNPADRFDTCGAFAAAACKAIAGQSFQVVPVAPEEISRRQTQVQIDVPTQKSPVRAIPQKNVGRIIVGAVLAMVALSLLGWLVAILRSAAAAGADLVSLLMASWPVWGFVACVVIGLVGWVFLRRRKSVAVADADPAKIAAAKRVRESMRKLAWTAAGILLVAAQVVAGFAIHPLISLPEEAETEITEPTPEELLAAMPAASHDAGADFTNRFGFRMICVKPGKYMSAGGQQETIAAPFWISSKETTVAQYLLFLEDRHGAHRVGDPNTNNSPRWLRSALNDGSEDIPPFARNQFPITEISVTDAEEFCDWLTRSAGDGLTYRLPRFDQWVCAYRGGTETPYYWGVQFDANHANSRCTGEGTPPNANAAVGPVGQFPSPKRLDKHPWGLFDMAGNVAELVRDGASHTACGGSWKASTAVEFAPGAARRSPSPADDLGFRVVAEYQ